MRFILKLSILFIVYVLAAILGFYLWLNSDAGQQYLQKQLEGLLYDSISLRAKAEDLHISLPGILTAKQITLHDEEGYVGTIYNPVARADVMQLMNHVLSFQEIMIDKIELAKSDIVLDNTSSYNESEGLFSSVRIPNITIKKFIFGDKEASIWANLLYDLEEEVFYFDGHISDIKYPGSNISNIGYIDTILLSGGYFSVVDEWNLSQAKLSGSNFNFDANLNFALEDNKLSGSALVEYNSSSLLASLEWPNSGRRMNLQLISKGNILFSGTIDQPEIISDIDLDIKVPDSTYLSSGSFKINIHSLLNSKIIKNDFAIKRHMVSDAHSDSHSHDYMRASGSLNYDFHDLVLSSFKLQDKNLILESDLHMDISNKILVGDVHLWDKDISGLRQYLPFVKNGNLKLDVSLAKLYGKQNIHSKGLVTDFASDIGNFKKLNYEIDVNNLDFNNLETSLSQIAITKADLSAEDVVLAGALIKNFDLHAKNASNNHQLGKLQMIYNGKFASNKPIDSNVTFNGRIALVNMSEISGEITSFAGVLGKNTTKNIDKTIFHYGSNETHLKGRQKFGSESVLSYDARSVSGNLQGRIVFSNLSGMIFGKFLDSQLANSKLSGQIDINGTQHSPIIHMNYALSSIIDKKSGNVTNMKLVGDIDSNKAVMNMDIGQNQTSIGAIKIDINHNFSLMPFKYNLDVNRPLHARLDLKEGFNLAAFLPKSEEYKIYGLCTGHMSATGRLDKLNLEGVLKLSQGKYTHKNQGIKVKKISADIKAHGGGVVIDNISAEDRFGNKLSGKGKVRLDQDYSFNLDIGTNKFSPLSTPYVTGTISGDLHLEGDVLSSMITGKVTLQEINIKIPEDLQSNVPELNIVGSKRPLALSEKISYPLSFDIDVATTNKVSVTGWGVNAALAGELQVKGDVNQPLIFGKLHTVRGFYSEFGKTLSISKGNLDFRGAIIPSPYLDITGVVNTSEAEVRVILTGSIAKPEIFVESTPDMPQDKALALLLFGKNAASLSPFQVIQLADSARRLSGTGRKFNPLALGQKLLRVDTVNIKTDETNPDVNTIGVGKYLTDRVYIEVEGGQQNTARTKIEFQVTPQIFIDDSIANDGHNTVGINWRRDY